LKYLPCVTIIFTCSRYAMWLPLLVLERDAGRFAEAAALCMKLGDLDGATEMHEKAGPDRCLG